MMSAAITAKPSISMATTALDEHRMVMQKYDAQHLQSLNFPRLTQIFRLYESQEACDLVLAQGDKEIKVHSYLLKPISDFFAAACDGPFKVCY